MKGRIYTLLQRLVNLSGENTDIDLLIEKNSLVENIDETRKKINHLNNMMQSNRYFDETAQMLDKNSLLALQHKVKNYKDSLNLVKLEIKKVSDNEIIILEKIELGKFNVEKYTDLLKNISYKLVDDDVNSVFYNDLLEKKSVKLDYWNGYLQKEEKKLINLRKDIDVLRANKDNFEYDINKSRDRIDELNHNLENDLNYLNRTLKEQDENEMIFLNKKINKLENDYDNLVDSVGFLGLELFNLIDEESYIYAKSKLNEIIWKLEKVPYITENNYDNLNMELKSLIKEKDSIKLRISKNDYLNSKSVVLLQRIDDINVALDENSKDIDNIKKIINEIENHKIINLNNSIIDLNLEEEMDAIYNYDLNHLVEYSLILKNTSLKFLESYRKKMTDELDKISKQLALKDGLIDETKKLQDIDNIKFLSEKINYINHRLENKEDIYDIANNLEILIDSIDFDFLVFQDNDKDDNYEYLKVIEIIEEDIEMHIGEL